MQGCDHWWLLRFGVLVRQALETWVGLFRVCWRNRHAPRATTEITQSDLVEGSQGSVPALGGKRLNQYPASTPCCSPVVAWPWTDAQSLPLVFEADNADLAMRGFGHSASVASNPDRRVTPGWSYLGLISVLYRSLPLVRFGSLGRFFLVWLVVPFIM